MEPFKATKLWNKIIQDFRSLMPLKRHRWRMKQYDHCFTTTEAVDWLHEYLQGSGDFGPWVTRNQAVSLLDKFVQSKVIQGVKVHKVSKTKLSAEGFEDNGHLYRFVPVSPIKKLRSAFSSRTNLRSASRSPKSSPDLPSKPVPKMQSLDEEDKPSTTHITTPHISHGTIRPRPNPMAALRKSQRQGSHPKPLGERNDDPSTGVMINQSEPSVATLVPECTFVARNVTRTEIEDVWKSATLMRLQRLLWLSSLEGFIDANVVNPKHLIHNCTHLSRGGVVLVTNKEQDLPHWVLSAMRCLARWPNQTDSSLPAYPGFERDVFRTVFNYFDTLPEPLLTYNLYPLVTEAFITAEYRDRGIAPPGYQEDVLPPCASTTNGLTNYDSVENLMMNMTMARYPEYMPTPGGYVNPPVATPDGMLDRRSPYFGKGGDVKERDRPVCRRSMRIQTTPQIPHGNVVGRQRSFNGLHQDNHSFSHSRLSNSEDDSARNRHSSSISGSSLNSYPKQDYERDNHRNINRMGDISEYYRDKCRPRKRRKAQSAQGVLQDLHRFNSESDIHRADFDAESHQAEYQSRHYVSMTDIVCVDDDEPIPYMDAPCLKVIGRSPQLGIPSPPVDSNSETAQVNSTSNQSAIGSSPNLEGHSFQADGPSPTESNTSKESSFVRLFRSSKKWGSASDLVQRLLKKKSSESSLGYQPISRDSSTNQTPPFTTQPSRSTTNLAVSSKNVSPTESATSNKISPSYPPPMRATLSMSQIVSSSAENSTNTTPDYPTSYGQRPVSTYGMNQTRPKRTLDPFQQGLSQSTQNLRSSEEEPSQWSQWRSHNRSSQQGLNQQASQDMWSSQHTLSRSNKAVSAYSLNRSGMSELGYTGPRQMKRSDSTSSLYLNEDQSYMQESLKLCCLLLSPPNRRKLHLLLKLMCKIEQNEELELSKTRSARNLVLQTFTRCILRCRQELDLNERLAMRIVEYLMDNHATIFAVPKDLQADVEERLVYLRRGQIKYSPEDDLMKAPPAFCRQVSMSQYEEQKVTTSQKAMEDLLKSIVQDNRISAKDKRKKLKQFQKAYPDIYTKIMQPASCDVENTLPPSHCQKITTNEYKKESVSASQRALEGLLESIISSTHISVKDKKKKLKRFQKEYPDIYRRRLPTNESEAQLFADNKPKIKQPMVNMKKSLSSRWKSIR